MKRLIVLFFALMFVSLASVKASTCSDEKILELSSLANNVNVSLERETRVSAKYKEDASDTEYQEDTFPAFYVTIYNLTSDLNASIYRVDTDKTVYVTSKDADDDGIIYVDAGFATLVKTFKVKIRSNSPSCKNEVLKEVTVTTPMYNLNSQYDVCSEYTDFELCKEFTTVDYSDISQSTFNEKLEVYKEEKAKEEKRANSVYNKVLQFISKYKWIFITAVIVIAASVVVYIIRRKKSRLV